MNTEQTSSTRDGVSGPGSAASATTAPLDSAAVNPATPKTMTGDEESASPITEQLAGRAHELVDRTAESAAEAEARLRAGASQTGQRLSDAQVHAKEVSDDRIAAVKDYVHRHPIESLGIALLSGVVLSGILRR